MAKKKWEVDRVHSRLEFVVRHMMIANVKGVFKSFHALIIADPEDLTDAEIDLSIDANSIDTHKKERDEHLRSKDFFNVENYPKLKFKVTEIKQIEKDKYNFVGDFTILGITKSVIFDVKYEGTVRDEMTTEEVARFVGHTKINRHDFGLTWNSAFEADGVVVGEEVKINIDIQIRKDAEPKLIF